MKSTEKVGQLFFPGIPGAELDASTRELLDEIRPGGVCLFTRNIRGAAQTRELLDGLRALLPETPFLSLDQEGGLVDRLRRVITPMAAPAKMGSPDDAARLGTLIASAVRVLGFNMDFAPVVDVIDESRAGRVNGIQTRNFGSSKEDVVEYASAFLSSLEKGGILGCIKHFPGLGASAVDSHEELPRVEIEREEFEAVDLYPYIKLLPRFEKLSVMVGHAAYPNSGPSLQETDQSGKLLPSSLSPATVNDLLRNKLGFDGLTITDDLEMGAIVKNYGMGAACVMAVNAGIDMLSICASPDAIRQGFAAVTQAVDSGEIPELRIQESLRRIEKYRSYLTPPTEFDEAELARVSTEIEAFNKELE